MLTEFILLLLHSLHLRIHPYRQMLAPPHSLYLERCRPCPQTLLPLHSLIDASLSFHSLACADRRCSLRNPGNDCAIARAHRSFFAARSKPFDYFRLIPKEFLHAYHVHARADPYWRTSATRSRPVGCSLSSDCLRPLRPVLSLSVLTQH